MLKFSEMFEFSKEKFRKIPILKEFEWFEWFEWFGPSPTEPFNSAAHRRPGRESAANGADGGRGDRVFLPMVALTQLANYLTLKGSFLGCIEAKFASKYSLESSRRDLHNALLCTALLSQNFR